MTQPVNWVDYVWQLFTEQERGRPEDATQKFQEAFSLAPRDEEIERLIAFSQVYESRNQDLRYRIFIKYVPFR